MSLVDLDEGTMRIITAMAAEIGIARAALQEARNFIIAHHGDQLDQPTMDIELGRLLYHIDMGIRGRK